MSFNKREFERDYGIDLTVSAVIWFLVLGQDILARKKINSAGEYVGVCRRLNSALKKKRVDFRLISLGWNNFSPDRWVNGLFWEFLDFWNKTQPRPAVVGSVLNADPEVAYQLWKSLGKLESPGFLGDRRLPRMWHWGVNRRNGKFELRRFRLVLKLWNRLGRKIDLRGVSTKTIKRLLKFQGSLLRMALCCAYIDRAWDGCRVDWIRLQEIKTLHDQYAGILKARRVPAEEWIPEISLIVREDVLTRFSQEFPHLAEGARFAPVPLLEAALEKKFWDGARVNGVELCTLVPWVYGENLDQVAADIVHWHNEKRQLNREALVGLFAMERRVVALFGGTVRGVPAETLRQLYQEVVTKGRPFPPRQTPTQLAEWLYGDGGKVSSDVRYWIDDAERKTHSEEMAELVNELELFYPVNPMPPAIKTLVGEMIQDGAPIPSRSLFGMEVVDWITSNSRRPVTDVNWWMKREQKAHQQTTAYGFYEQHLKVLFPHVPQRPYFFVELMERVKGGMALPESPLEAHQVVPYMYGSAIGSRWNEWHDLALSQWQKRWEDVVFVKMATSLEGFFGFSVIHWPRELVKWAYEAMESGKKAPTEFKRAQRTSWVSIRVENMLDMKKQFSDVRRNILEPFGRWMLDLAPLEEEMILKPIRFSPTCTEDRVAKLEMDTVSVNKVEPQGGEWIAYLEMGASLGAEPRATTNPDWVRGLDLPDMTAKIVGDMVEQQVDRSWAESMRRRVLEQAKIRVARWTARLNKPRWDGTESRAIKLEV